MRNRRAWAGAGLALIARPLLARALLLKIRRDVRALNSGDIEPLLSGYAHDAVMRFNDGEHRWAGEHRGRDAIGRFLQSFVDAGLQGHVSELFVAGAPWRLTLIARFDDHARDPAGEVIYRNRTVLLARTRWGRIVLHEDFYEDTERIVALERRLSERETGPSG
ncbi:MAG TPA: nuclear transport factor 2 family protein [Solirubrobacteraceae bacterium]|jgi:ketosteroid isomerase-like protein|nr:nuclear transport factor 2 family protein [Solirubrobacteraceae bacterium]